MACLTQGHEIDFESSRNESSSALHSASMVCVSRSRGMQVGSFASQWFRVRTVRSTNKSRNMRSHSSHEQWDRYKYEQWSKSGSWELCPRFQGRSIHRIPHELKFLCAFCIASLQTEAVKSVTRTMVPKVKPAVDLGLNTSCSPRYHSSFSQRVSVTQTAIWLTMTPWLKGQKNEKAAMAIIAPPKDGAYDSLTKPFNLHAFTQYDSISLPAGGCDQIWRRSASIHYNYCVCLVWFMVLRCKCTCTCKHKDFFA